MWHVYYNLIWVYHSSVDRSSHKSTSEKSDQDDQVSSKGSYYEHRVEKCIAVVEGVPIQDDQNKYQNLKIDVIK